VGALDHVTARARDAVRTPTGAVFHRQWEVYGARGATTVRLHFSFIDGYTEHTLHVRGTSASATVDFELNTYVLHEHSQDLLDLDHLVTAARAARSTLVQAGATFGSAVLAKAGLAFDSGPYQASITGAVKRFYECLRARTPLDERLAPALALTTVRLAESVARAVELEPPARRASPRRRPPPRARAPPRLRPPCSCSAAPASSAAPSSSGCARRGSACAPSCATPRASPWGWPSSAPSS